MFRLDVQRNAENTGFASSDASVLKPYGMILFFFASLRLGAKIPARREL
jgi:hypothetical protein